MIDTYGLTELLRKLSTHSTKVLIIAMALFMLVYSVSCIFLQLDSDLFGGDLIIVAFVITVAMSVLTIFTKKIDVFRLVGLFALMLAIQRFYVKFMGFSWDNNTYTVLFDLYFMGLAINLMVTGVSFTFGKVIRRNSMMITSILMAIYEFIVLEFFSAPPTVGEAGFYYAYLICLIGMYLCIAGLMDMDLIRNSTRDARYSKSLEAFRNEYQYDRGSPSRLRSRGLWSIAVRLFGNPVPGSQWKRRCVSSSRDSARSLMSLFRNGTGTTGCSSRSTILPGAYFLLTGSQWTA